MQDILGLGKEARMNIPSTLGGNWVWRLDGAALTDELFHNITHLFSPPVEIGRAHVLGKIVVLFTTVEKSGRLED